SSRIAMRPGISTSAIWISLRPNSARPRSLTLKSFAADPLAERADLAGEGMVFVLGLLVAVMTFLRGIETWQRMARPRRSHAAPAWTPRSVAAIGRPVATSRRLVGRPAATGTT